MAEAGDFIRIRFQEEARRRVILTLYDLEPR